MYAPNMDLLTEYVQRNGWKQIDIELFYQVQMRIIAVTDSPKDLEAIFIQDTHNWFH